MYLLLNYLLVLLAVAVEVVLGSAARLRRAHWTLAWYHGVERRAGSTRWWHGWAGVLLVCGVPFLVVLAVFTALHAWSPWLGYAFNLVVLIAMLGPEDLAAEVAAHQRVLDGDTGQGLPAYLRHAAPVDLGPPVGDAEFDETRGELAALALAAEHAWFQPIFWFLLAGPAGAVLYRLCANLRRAPTVAGDFAHRLALLREALECVPARVTALALGIAGTLVPVLETARRDGWFTWGASATLVARAALAATDHGRIREVIGGDVHVYRINQMLGLLRRTLTVWLVLAAALALAMA